MVIDLAEMYVDGIVAATCASLLDSGSRFIARVCKTSFAPWPLRLITPEPAAFLPSTNRWPRAWSGMQGRVISVNSAVVADGGGGDYGDYWEL